MSATVIHIIPADADAQPDSMAIEKAESLLKAKCNDYAARSLRTEVSVAPRVFIYPEMVGQPSCPACQKAFAMEPVFQAFNRQWSKTKGGFSTLSFACPNCGKDIGLPGICCSLWTLQTDLHSQFPARWMGFGRISFTITNRYSDGPNGLFRAEELAEISKILTCYVIQIAGRI